MRKYVVPLIIGILAALFVLEAVASEDVIFIIKKVDEKNNIETSIAKMSMLIYPDVDDKDNRRILKVIAYSKGDEDSYMEFISPKTIKGLRILSKGGDQWVYFASTGRVRKIAGKSKKKSVKGVGGDFSYEDLSGGTLEEKYTFKILKNESDKWTLEGKPKDSDSSYTKIIIHVNKSDYTVPKIEFYTEEEGHYKDLIQSDIKTISGREVPTQLTMINYDKESKTVVIIHDAEYDIKIDDKYFNPTRFYK